MEKIEILPIFSIIPSIYPQSTQTMIDIKILRSNQELVKKALYDKVTK